MRTMMKRMTAVRGGAGGREGSVGSARLTSGRRASSRARCAQGQQGRARGLRCAALFGGWNPLAVDPAEATRKAYLPQAEECKRYIEEFKSLSDAELCAKTADLRERAQMRDVNAARGADGVRDGDTASVLNALLPEAFAVVSEASHRVLGLRPYDVQLIGAMVLHAGKVAEMKTGEGKTLVAVLAAFLNALSGQGVHVVTVNDYLARRDAEWVGQVHRFLGLSVGIIQQNMAPSARRAAYACDVTYVTNTELGFDYLRDNLADTPEALVLRDFNYCIIDEVDSILIDEARTPLIISGEGEPAGKKYATASKIADAFERDVHYTVREKEQSALLTDEGYEAAEDVLQVSDLYDPREQWAAYVINAIIAKELKLRDTHYIVRKGEVIIVDEFTGRTMPGRRWGSGLHQAIEAKECIEIQKETVSVASISYQNFFTTFPKLAGMTGTASTEVKEFGDIYNLAVEVVPTNRELVRVDHPDVVFVKEDFKWEAVRKEIAYMHSLGLPILIGTTTVETSEELSRDLDELQISHRVLNAKPENVQRESEIVAQGGRKGAVTIATNMAGRGTDILLGGNPEFMARLKLREHLFPRLVGVGEDGKIAYEPGTKNRARTPVKDWRCDPKLFPCALSDDARAAIDAAVKHAISVHGERALPELEVEDILSTGCEKTPTDDDLVLAIRAAFLKTVACYETVTSAEEEAEVIKLGGLHVIGTERHDSRRVDNQLRGRSGRQGDPGSTRFFLSISDRLFRLFGGDRIKGIMNTFGLGEDLPLEDNMVSRSLDEAQKKVEQYLYDARKSMYEYDKVLNLQRSKLYAERRRLLLTSDLIPTLKDFAERTVTDIVDYHMPEDAPITDAVLATICTVMPTYCKFMSDITPETLQSLPGTGADVSSTAGAGASSSPSSLSREAILKYLQSRAIEAVDIKLNEIETAATASSNPEDHELAAEAARHLCIVNFDATWKKVLQAMDFLQTSVRLRGYAQKDPLSEYKLQGFRVFAEEMASTRRNVVYGWYQFNTPSVLQWRENRRESMTEKEKTPVNV